MNIVIKSSIVLLLTLFGLTSLTTQVAAQSNDQDSIKAAVARAIKPIVKSAESYVTQKECFSCHHQSLPVIAAAQAELLGIRVDRQWLETQRIFTADFFLKRKGQLAEGRGVPGGPFTAGYALAQLITTAQLTSSEEEQSPARPAGADALVGYLWKTYKPDRPWKINTIRPPLESSDFTATGLAVAALSRYEPDQLSQHAADIRQWYRQTQAVSAEDRAFELMGWYWLTNSDYAVAARNLLPTNRENGSRSAKSLPATVATPEEIDVEGDREQLQIMISELKQRQRKDGGWGQTDDMASDAYATGLVLTALSVANSELVREKCYRRGIQYLLKNQENDGSWHVLTRSKPIQEYFESDFPHGKDQFISIAASCWSVIALSRYVDGQRKTGR